MGKSYRAVERFEGRSVGRFDIDDEELSFDPRAFKNKSLTAIEVDIEELESMVVAK